MKDHEDGCRVVYGEGCTCEKAPLGLPKEPHEHKPGKLPEGVPDEVRELVENLEAGKMNPVEAKLVEYLKASLGAAASLAESNFRLASHVAGMQNRFQDELDGSRKQAKREAWYEGHEAGCKNAKLSEGEEWEGCPYDD